MTKTLLAALAAALLLPAAAFAQCEREEASMSCADGTVWDAEQEVCVPVSS
ncbi:adenylosuccinate lyase [Wenxinia saemankumensis]|uniref:Chitin binding Peritrophin-A domain-containing protein n=1 Tax=Wenxinia saemankumensis TaxID=1447782 RepID=A0A1M6EXT2_9RHOB|nr:adenylosuccinate lyase [Wenxinia saemankumensis]SHI90248.1 Chitin binding Peritrophin-A domain-containing protein [Wenxinia saemankumensis]